MRRVIVESPYRADNPTQQAKHLDYARAAIRNAIARGEAPMASHLLYTQPGVLDDGSPHERELGIALGFQWMTVAHAVAVYTDLGISDGMKRGIAQAHRDGMTVEYRSLGPQWAANQTNQTESPT